MKKFSTYLVLLVFIACADKQLSHTETAKIVVESFYQKDNSKLKKYTTAESYASFISIQDMMTAAESGASDFNIVQEIVDRDIAWVKFTTSYEEKPETFKLVQEEGQWVVTEKGLREKGPF
ncbi:hypothetical protein [Maribacter sp. 2308TA10-17]|uniref:hypothetical protein n=1 Tax=Maribacter sp. 2308TA10-17 TaxID=3386276 RepID=UPI0039BD2B44